MKRKHLIYIGILCYSLVGCTKDFVEINTPPKDPVTASNEELLNGIISSLPMTAGEYSVINSWIYPITQQGVVAGSHHYNFDNARDGLWETYYQALASYRLLETRIATDPVPASKNNLHAMIKTLMAYRTFKTTNYFGNIPYSKAGFAPAKDPAGYKVSYDKQEDIYTAILTDLKWAVDNFSTAAGQYSPGAYDTFFKGDITKWIKFANSLRLQVAITMHHKNPTLAGPQIVESLAKPLLEKGDDVGLWPAQIPGLQFQWRQWSFVQDCNLRLGSTMWNLLSDNNSTDGSGIFDLRARLFFETNGTDLWAPIPQNQNPIVEIGTPYDVKVRNNSGNWNNKGGNHYSAFNLNFANDIEYIPELILTAAQVYFLKAEAYNRGLGVTANQATAKAEYEKGVESSLTMWKKVAFNTSKWVQDKPTAENLSTQELNDVLQNTKVAYVVGDPANSLLKIYAQLWIDQYRQPFDSWTLLRRTGGKTPMATLNASNYTNTYGSLNRFRYPDNEQSYNNENWKAETGSSDLNSKKIWIQP
ncbi:SusD/RagB family nutrient-binding outer membrane lipoprotein [Sphingobacterium psychroaquaticum]|uniref:SusD/RagB family nutrient-binding outer membrane lipoprotein n=1 Tax=Sphingobacterium psychroaquaticum TaxID=561061 RepID=UPI00106A7CDD|nr:SusD/RagB family nutrient-binding outer membrane lipoprotein [Sphingobacterium psychroaquaticum]QBQ42469.1 SusD/RagB family nutrient-binding outer membrane lipoprotein [Sphingobacterium psychroaquaticum]